MVERPSDGILAPRMNIACTSFWHFAGASVNHAPSQTHIPPLTAAAQNGHVACVRLLLAKGAQVGFATPDGATALMAAASGGHVACVAALIKAGADVAHTDHSGMSAMLLAAAGGHDFVIQCLIKHGASVERESFQVAAQT